MTAPGQKIMREAQSIVVESLSATVDDLCQKFGVWRTARALALAAWKHHQTVNQISHLSNRTRRDIGLPEVDDALGEIRFSPWGTLP